MSRACYANSRSRSRGMIFVIALGIIVVLTAMLLSFAQEMRTEALSSANRLSAIQAEAIEHGAEQWVLAQVEANAPDALDITSIPADTLPLGNGYFWVLRPDPDQDTTHAFGISDESGKVNLSNAGVTRLMALPGMTNEAAASIVDWCDGDENPTAGGVESSYYTTLAEPYSSKNARLETPEEVLLIKDVTPELLYGYDRNRDGVIDESERAVGGTAGLFNSSTEAARGISPFTTVFTVERNRAADGSARVNVNTRNIQQFNQQVRNLLVTAGKTQDTLTEAHINDVMVSLNLYINRKLQANPNANPIPSIGEFYTASKLTAAEFGAIADKITTTGARNLRGMINVNTASKQALATLPGLVASDADLLVGSRTEADKSSIAWIFTALSADKAVGITGRITTRSYQYSADILAASPDGRAFKRVRVVIDARQAPAKIMYRKDLTSLGWPLDPSIQQQLIAGLALSTGSSILKMGAN